MRFHRGYGDSAAKSNGTDLHSEQFSRLAITTLRELAEVGLPSLDR